MSDKKLLDPPAKKNAKSLSVRTFNITENLNEHNDNRNLTTPTELLMEFLTSVMTKDYEQALKYCSEILYYEPENTTALEFYPLIVEKLELMEESTSDSSTSDSSLNSSSSSENIFFNTVSQHILKEEETAEGKLENHDVGEKRCTEADSNVNISSSVLLSKNIKQGNIKTSKSSNSDQKPEAAELSTAQSDARMPSNLLLHPTRTITLNHNNVTDTKTTSCSNSKEKIQNVSGNKGSQILLQMSPTITFFKKSSPLDLTETKNP